MSDLKNKFGDNVSWLLIDVAEQIKCEIEDSSTIETGFEIYGETEDGCETQCEVELIDLLESASVAICDAEDQLTAITKQRNELQLIVENQIKLLKGYSDLVLYPASLHGDIAELEGSLSTIKEQEDVR